MFVPLLFPYNQSITVLSQWRYIQTAISFILGLMRRDAPTPPVVVRFLMEQTTSVQPVIRLNAQL